MDFSILNKIPYETRSHCEVCEKKLSTPLIELPDFPLTEIFTNKRPSAKIGLLDQYFHFCGYCGHGQISRVIDPSILYTSQSYFHRTSESGTARKANDAFCDFIDQVAQHASFDTVVDFGCNDIYLLKTLEKRAKKLIGIDPVLSGKEKELSTGKIKVIGKPIEEVDLSFVLRKGKNLILSSHTMEHLNDPKSILLNLLSISSSETIHIHQFPGFDTLVKNGRFDQIFHQHLRYYSLASFSYLLDVIGAELIDYRVNYEHWGTLMVAFKKTRNTKKNHERSWITGDRIKKGFQEFQYKMKETKKCLESFKEEKLYGYGASLMLPVLLYHLKSDLSLLDGVFDDDIKKQGLYYINLPTSILSPNRIKDFSTLNIVITTLSTTRSILPRVLSLAPRRIIFPLQII